MTAANKIAYAELASSSGRDLGVTTWHRVTQEEVNTFAELTGDRQWIHLDVERAGAGPFGGTVVHGFFTVSLLPFFLDQLLEVTELSMGVNYGLDRVRFPSPLLVGTRVRGRAVIQEVEPRDGGRHARLVVRMTFEQEGTNRPACVADLVAIFYA